MEILRLAADTFEASVSRAAEILHASGVILYPTDTLYGLGTNALLDECVGKIYEIKGREEHKPIHGIVSDVAMAKRYGEVNDVGEALCEKFFPGPFTLIVRKHSQFNKGIFRDIETFGFRIPDNDFCIACARAFDVPITGTSANKSGSIPERTIEAVLEQLGESAKLVDLVIDAGELPPSQPSTVVDVSSGELKILREGAVPASKLINF